MDAPTVVVILSGEDRSTRYHPPSLVSNGGQPVASLPVVKPYVGADCSGGGEWEGAALEALPHLSILFDEQYGHAPLALEGGDIICMLEALTDGFIGCEESRHLEGDLVAEAVISLLEGVS